MSIEGADIVRSRNSPTDATRSSGGVAFLMAYGMILLIAGVLAFWLPVRQATLV
jgi:hypothetical protein